MLEARCAILPEKVPEAAQFLKFKRQSLKRVWYHGAAFYSKNASSSAVSETPLPVFCSVLEARCAILSEKAPDAAHVPEI